MIEADLGYTLHQSVQATKADLSHDPAAAFAFTEPGLRLRAAVTRQEFESWIAPEIDAIRGAVAAAMSAAGIADGAVDRVLLTGGTSLVPAVRHIFEERFGRERVLIGDAFTSVVRGLAMRARVLAETAG